jgi:phage major head subunit gpT-like protein
MIINRANIEALQIGYRTNFQGGFGGVTPSYGRVATTVPSTTAENLYPWLGNLPGMREWIGPRVAHNISTSTYKVANRTWEDTVKVNRDHIDDDQIGIYAPLFTMLGQAAAEHPDQLVWAQLAAGFSTVCFDGQFFFDTDHPVKDPTTGVETSVSNMQAGAGAPWFLLDTTRALKPLIYQERRKPVFTSFINLNDPNVFNSNEFVWGCDGRWNTGFGFWQMAFGSKAALTPENLRAGILAMSQFKSDEGRPLGVKPNLLVVGTSNQFVARDILVPETINGTSNVNRGLVEIQVSPYLP